MELGLEGLLLLALVVRGRVLAAIGEGREHAVVLRGKGVGSVPRCCSSSPLTKSTPLLLITPTRAPSP